jgi:iron complex transport system substrate-binding protein
MIKRLTITILILLNVLLILACESNNDKEQSSKSKDNAYSEVIDLKGRTVKVKRDIDRLIVSYQPALYFVLALDVQEKLVTSIDIQGRPIGEFTLPSAVYPQIEILPEIKGGSGNLNIEQIAVYKPDLVLLYPNNSLKTSKRLAEIDVPSIIIDPEDKEKFKQSITLLGEVLDAEEKATQLIRYYDTIVREIEQKINIHYGDKQFPKKRVYYADTDILSTISGDMFQSQMISDAQGINLSQSLTGWKQRISYEELIKWKPDVIIISSFSKLSVDNVLSETRLGDIPAVRDNNVYKMPSKTDPWDFPVPNAIIGTYWLASVFYPEVFDNKIVREKINEFYKSIYGDDVVNID